MDRRRLVFLFAALFAGSACETPAARAVRGPFLQNLGADHVTICWETPRSATATVRITDGEGNEVTEVATPEVSTRHELPIGGLAPGTGYAYEVFAAGKQSIGSGSFRTAPAPGKPVRFVAWGDSRKGDKIAAGLAARILDTGTGMCIHTGDLVNDGKNLSDWEKYVFGPLGSMMRSVCLWPAVGNHDLGMMPNDVSERSAFEYMFALPGAETYYSFDWGDAHFLVLDSENPSPEQYEFAERDLEKPNSKWLFAVLHRPPFSSSGHPSDIRMRTQFCPLLAKHNVDAIIVGHNHNYMLSKPIRHAYEKEQTRPYIEVVTGGGGAYPADFRTDDPWFDRAKTAFHFVLFEIEGERLNTKVIDGAGRVIDRFAVDRTKPAEDVAIYELIELERYLRGLNNTNNTLEGWPTGYLLEPGEEEGTLSYIVANPLQETLTLRLGFDLSPGLEFPDPVREISLDPGGSARVEVPFRVTSPGSLYPLRGPAIGYASPIGSATVEAGVPALALRRRVDARAIGTSVVIDGTADEEVWRDATEHGRFILWDDADLRYQNAASASTLRAVRDGEHLYLSFRRRVEPSDLENLPDSPNETDHYTIYLAGPKIALGYTVDVARRTSVEGTKGLGDGVESAVSVAEGVATWEIVIPLARFLEDLGEEGNTLFLNVMEKRRGEYYSFSPTFRQFFERENSAQLVLAQ